MSIPLEMADGSGEQERWQRFVARRTALELQMQLSVCDGCDSCGTRCTSGFTVTHAEWQAARAYFQSLPQEERHRLTAQQRTLPWPGGDESGPLVIYCRYRDLERNQCSIYPVRATICRLFGQTHWLPCPIEAVSAYPPDAASVWNSYREEKRKTWEEWEQEESTHQRENN